MQLMLYAATKEDLKINRHIIRHMVGVNFRIWSLGASKHARMKTFEQRTAVEDLQMSSLKTGRESLSLERRDSLEILHHATTK